MDTKLSCGVGNCVNNINGLCSAREIKVNGEEATSSNETLCETFGERSFKNAVTNIPNMNIPGEIKQLFTQNSIEMTPKVLCDAINCNYNQDRVCNASSVQINGMQASTSQDTKCETFRQG
ncbi:DUF1540 domain-containing protein [Clostridium sp. MB40-C1]|uniref:DUF1540 domain-containing protein n=1 Tax=Clostridium sp. MB40-C1 TaxID=3070996 RepID=UPI0027E0E886|nr:DUF1540 domain-containing protein [Clostridium sp. MB40-C1]WMJ80528.1 DUF1540 domain-containing protein [Clostridium sp. MB40-C1]